MFPSIGPSLASLRGSFAGLSLTSKQEGKEIEGIAKDLKEAERNWNWIQALLVDAEKRHIHDESVRVWLLELRELAYQIEDLRDVYEYEVVATEVRASKKALSSSGDASTSKRRKVEESVAEVRPSMLTSLSPLLDASFREQIARHIRKIKEEFDAIAKRRKALHLIEEDGQKYSSGSDDDIVRREPSSHLVVDPVFLGRDRELQQLRRLLIADHDDDFKNFEVIVVIGMGGIGKTTLAQHVCQDPQVIRNFDKIGWIHVSENFDLIRFTKAVIETFSGKASSLNESSALHKEAMKLIEDKKVLLVTDDVWNTGSWDSFVAPFHRALRQGSKILVTTRLPEVARGTRAVNSIALNTLSEEDGWCLLKKHAFRNQSSDMDNNAEFFKKLEEELW